MSDRVIVEERKLDRKDLILGMTQPEFQKLAESILIAVPYRAQEGINGGLATTLSIWRGLGTPWQPIEDSFGGFIEIQRAGMAKEFLKYCVDHPECDKLIMIDSDENVNWEVPYRLALWDQPIVSGVVCSHVAKRGVFAAFTVKDKYGVPRFPSVRYTKTMPSKGLIKAHNVGTGLLCVKKNVFETLFDAGEIPFFIPEDVRRDAVMSGALKYGEDMAFCRQAAKHGFQAYVDLACQAVHWKNIGVCWPQGNFDDEMDPQAWTVDVKDYLHG